MEKNEVKAILEKSIEDWKANGAQIDEFFGALKTLAPFFSNPDTPS